MLARASSKWQTRPLVRGGARYRQNSKCQTVINIWSWAPDGAQNQDALTDWSSVVMWLWQFQYIILIPYILDDYNPVYSHTTGSMTMEWEVINTYTPTNLEKKRPCTSIEWEDIETCSPTKVKQSHVTTDDQSVSKSWIRAPSVSHDRTSRLEGKSPRTPVESWIRFWWNSIREIYV
jgi:hypothetical protein